MGDVERTSIGKDACELLLSKPMHGWGDKLNTPTITARLTRPREGIIAAKFTHWAGADDVGPEFSLLKQDSTSPPIAEANDNLEIHSGPVGLNMNTSPKNLSFSSSSSSSSSSKRLTGHSFRSIGLVSSQDSPKYNIHDGVYAEHCHYILLELDLSVHEKIYGHGERFGPFIKNGQSIDIWKRRRRHLV